MQTCGWWHVCAAPADISSPQILSLHIAVCLGLLCCHATAPRVATTASTAWLQVRIFVRCRSFSRSLAEKLTERHHAVAVLYRHVLQANWLHANWLHASASLQPYCSTQTQQLPLELRSRSAQARTIPLGLCMTPAEAVQLRRSSLRNEKTLCRGTHLGSHHVAAAGLRHVRLDVETPQLLCPSRLGQRSPAARAAIAPSATAPLATWRPAVSAPAAPRRLQLAPSSWRSTRPWICHMSHSCSCGR